MTVIGAQTVFSMTKAGNSGNIGSSGSSGTAVPQPFTLVDSISDLKKLPAISGQTVQTKGYYSPGDGGHGTYYYSLDDSGTNNGNKIKSNVKGSWILLSDSINVLQWGAKNTEGPDSSAAINECIRETRNDKVPKTILIPEGTYSIFDTIFVRGANTKIRLLGTLKNTNGNNKTTLAISPTYYDHNGVLENGIPVYEAANNSIDGEGSGCIDQNCQNSTPWDFENSELTRAFHSLYVSNCEGVKVNNLTIKNSNMWSLSVELCKDIQVENCKVYNGFCNNRKVNGKTSYLGGSDGIHLVDCINSQVTKNYVESGDDAICISSSRAISYNHIISGNICWTKVFAYEADGKTLNNTSVPGRYPIAIYCEAVGKDCSLSNVIASNNIVNGGQGLFCIYDIGVPHSGTVSKVTIKDNQFSNISSPGNPLISPFPVEVGWQIDGGAEISIVGNSFSNISRWGSIRNTRGTVIVKNNSFFGYKAPNQAQFPSQNPAVLWLSSGYCNLTVESNIFQDCEVTAISIGATGDFTHSQFGLIKVTNNSFINCKNALESYGADHIIYCNNETNSKSGQTVLIRSYKTLKIKENSILGVQNGNSNFFNIANQPDYPATSTVQESNQISYASSVI